ncbi:MAG: magnesium/cobalt transporter CorA [Helicobacter sp.]|uniref:magnesium/cobalt transporter CorA n=1 Tax=Helicobacter sp. 10-6591 TaxID=2004998 RepID=UPI000DCE67DF|nr:magnesium/cobalt transporter CorA [Helicobacter sp. 10-6591]MCI6218326.1 magnesium/cobalt transporter CorA [Helicobacter sp.]MCI7485072.1 magnesium/cobalt transporter CorA [Helicobacter sp.]MDD7567723.1 magnesium/cobalt transporter CorA [Helicobacter sp.]MDY5740140.1 magnesium/cobalt transporter CorA [Helicobacter sp.]RAX55789.1 magnesium and cobalt transport protein CorA [Helicobacter sp. 10-6591]
MNVFFKQGGFVSRESFNGEFDSHKTILWIDLFAPSSIEIDHIANTYNLDIPTKEEREEIEQSARYWEDSNSITINTYFLIRAGNELVNETVTFILHKNILFTLRYSEFKVFEEIEAIVLASPKNFESGFDLIAKMFEARVEKDADLLESAAKETRILRKNVFNEKITDYEHTLERLSNLQELNMSVRDSLFDKRRAITAILKSDKADSQTKKNLTIVLKDLNSLVEFTAVNMNALDNVQNILTNQINIEQNKTIKLFTVVTVAMMPPTLIGTIYGMNFDVMPETHWDFGYPIVLVVMALSTLFPIVYFKKKGWL